jgi:hypothetical protein
MPDFFGGSMHSFQMPPQLFGGMSSAQFFAQQPPPSFFAQPPSGALGAGFLHSADAGEGGASPSAGNDDADADSTGAAGFAARKGKAPKRARTSAAKGIGGAPEPAEAVSGGGMRRVGSIDSGLGGEDADDDWQGADGDKKATHKQRFVWTADLHRRCARGAARRDTHARPLSRALCQMHGERTQTQRRLSEEAARPGSPLERTRSSAHAQPSPPSWFPSARVRPPPCLQV